MAESPTPDVLDRGIFLKKPHSSFRQAYLLGISAFIRQTAEDVDQTQGSKLMRNTENSKINSLN